jgi:putative NADPH-quinone reductase
MKTILVINGHPNPESFNQAIFETYVLKASKENVLIETIEIAKLKFNPSLEFGYQKRVEMEPDLIEAQEKISRANHLVWIHPVWWGGLPALTKGFIDRVFVPGFAFKYRENSVWWDKLLAGKTAHIITTLDQPAFFYRLVFGRPSVNQLKKSTLGFCGIKTKKISYFGPVRNSTESQRKLWLVKVKVLAQNDSRSK